MNRKNLLSLLFILCGLFLLVSSKKRYPEPKTKANIKPKPVKLNIDILPPLQDILESLGLTRFLKDLIKMGVTETRLLVRLSAMDFRMMSIEWDGVTNDEINKLKDEIASMIIKATVIEEEVRPELLERTKLAYGRVYIPNSVQSFEYILGSFGSFPPVGKHKLEIPSPEFGCESDDVTNIDYQGSVIAVMRGNCTFLAKALNAKRFNAGGIIIVNNEDRLESPASGLGVDKNITEAAVLSLNKFPVLALANTTWAKLSYTYSSNVQAGVATYIDMVPLKCKSGGICTPLLEEEKKIQDEVSWGSARVRSSGSSTGSQVRSFDFLTSNFGGQLPSSGPIDLVYAEPRNGCSALQEDMAVDVGAVDVEAGIASKIPPSNKYANLAVVVERGGCRFDIKALHAQNAGASVLVIVEKDDNALQRVGGMQPDSGFVGIPSILVTAAAGEHLQSLLGNTRSDHTRATLQLTPAEDSTGADAWIELAHTEWSTDPQQLIMQLDGQIQKQSLLQKQGVGSGEIVAWLHRKMDAITNKKKKSIDTDGH